MPLSSGVPPILLQGYTLDCWSLSTLLVLVGFFCTVCGCGMPWSVLCCVLHTSEFSDIFCDNFVSFCFALLTSSSVAKKETLLDIAMYSIICVTLHSLVGLCLFDNWFTFYFTVDCTHMEADGVLCKNKALLTMSYNIEKRVWLAAFYFFIANNSEYSLSRREFFVDLLGH